MIFRETQRVAERHRGAKLATSCEISNITSHAEREDVETGTDRPSSTARS